MLDVGGVLGNETAVRGAGHRRQECGEARVSTEYLDDEKTLVRAGRSPQAVRELDRSRDAGAEADAVVGAVDVVVHGLRDRDDVYAFIVQTFSVAESVVAADGDQRIDTHVLEIAKHVLCNIVDRL